MRLLVLSSVLSLTVATLIACNSGSGDDSNSGSEDLTHAAAQQTPQQKAASALVGAWSTGGDKPIAVVISLNPDGTLAVTRDMPHVQQPNDPPDALPRDQLNLDGKILTVDPGGNSGTAMLNQFAFDHGDANQELQTWKWALNGTTLQLTETLDQFVVRPFGADAGPDKVVDGGAGSTTLRAPLTLTRQDSFCGAGGDSDCFTEFQNGIFKPTLDPACKDREDLCMFCGKNNKCSTGVPSSCELARDSCVTSIEACEFAPQNNGGGGVTGTTGEVTTINADGQKIDCKNSHSGGSVCCILFDQKGGR